MRKGQGSLSGLPCPYIKGMPAARSTRAEGSRCIDGGFARDVPHTAAHPHDASGTLSRAIQWLLRQLGRAASAIAIWFIALILLFEEWGWERLAAVVEWIGDLPGLRWIEGRIRALPPYGALALFIIPFLALLPIKIVALYWLGHGHKALGLGLIVAAKLGGTAVTARLFMLTRPTLMRLAWFARWFNKWMAFKDRVLARVKSSAAWQQWTAFKRTVKDLTRKVVQALGALFGRR
jgi:hypothetical protein